ncbi:hypothetical protein DCC39_15275 [Pueribacillus theae]|uniref:Uncharacterized protein n=1 Tax=Pueribacillus theae TaxID=2171751 RepID=A0A2U1JSG2_9BACI|nr:hypothetical protein [Pueribacillus theae]PWA08146.1 hypothetical protein DCC39_15275 [Pueribacillus theae]
MQINPKYGENIIVGVQYNSEFSWYVTERDCWILDLEKRKNDFIKNGFEYDVAELLQFRSNFLIVDKKTAGDYLAYLRQYKV